MRATKFSKFHEAVKAGEVDALLRICEAFELGKRPIPGYVRTALVRLQPYWGKRKMPAAVLEAQRVLRRVHQ